MDDELKTTDDGDFICECCGVAAIGDPHYLPGGQIAYCAACSQRESLRAAIVKAITPVLWDTSAPIMPDTGGSCDHWLIPARHIDARDMLEDIADLAIDAFEAHQRSVQNVEA